MTSLLAVMVKELRQAFRDRRTAFMLLVAPVIQLAVLGYAVDLDVEDIPTIVCDQDQTPESRSLARGLLAGSTFTAKAQTTDPAQAQQALEDGEATFALLIPRGFGRRLQNGRTATVQGLVDGTDPNQAQVASSAVTQYVTTLAVSLAERKVALGAAARGAQISMPRIRLEPRVYYNPGLRSSIFMVPGVLAMILVIVTTVVTAMGLAREREAGTMEQLMVTPIRPAVLLTGKCLPFAILGLVDVAAILLVGSLLFGVPMQGPLVVVFSASAIYLMTTLGTGIFVSAITGSQQQAVLATIFFLMPAVLLSGFMTPIDNMPHWIQPITWINPMRYYVEILRACLLKNAGFSDLWLHFAALLGLGVAILTLSSLRFNKRLR